MIKSMDARKPGGSLHRSTGKETSALELTHLGNPPLPGE